MEHLDQILLLVLFVVLPLAQRGAKWLQERRAQAVARERARRADLDVSAPAREAGEGVDAEDAEQRGEVLWKRMLEAIGAEEVAAAPPEDDVGAPERAREPGAPERAREVVAPLQPAHAPPVHLGEALPTFTVAPLGTIGPPIDEDAIEAGRIERGSLAELSAFDPTERTEQLAVLPGFAPSAADAETAAAERATRRRARAPYAGADWRRAIVLAEVLAPPVALRETRAGDPWSP